MPAEWAWLWPQLSTAITTETLRTSGNTGKEGLKSASSHTLVPKPVNDLRENLCMTFNVVHALTVQGERLWMKSTASGRIQVRFIDLAWNSLHGLKAMGWPCSRIQLCWETTGEPHPSSVQGPMTDPLVPTPPPGSHGNTTAKFVFQPFLVRISPKWGMLGLLCFSVATPLPRSASPGHLSSVRTGRDFTS